MCVQGPSGPRYCSRKCNPATSGQCNGGGCKKTNIPSLYVCGKPGAGGSPAPTPPSGGGGSGKPDLNPGGGGGGTKPGKDTTPPKVTITSPAGCEKTGTTVTVKAVVTDNVKVKKVELRVDNIVLAAKVNGPYTFKVVLKPGGRMIKVTGRDTSGLVAHAMVHVYVGGASAGKGAPAPKPPSTSPGTSTPLAGTFGASCTSPDKCQSKLCANDLTLGRSYCTQDCTLNPCPQGAGCFSASGGMSICAPLASTDDGGYTPNPVAGSGCSMGAGRTLPGGLVLLLLGSLLLRRRRR